MIIKSTSNQFKTRLSVELVTTFFLYLISVAMFYALKLTFYHNFIVKYPSGRNIWENIFADSLFKTISHLCVKPSRFYSDHRFSVGPSDLSPIAI